MTEQVFKWMYILLLGLNFGFETPAQEFSMDYGKPSDYEFSMETYEKDKEAEALIIFDKTLTKFETQADNSMLVVMERKTKIKVFNEAGFKYAEIEVPIYRKGDIFEKVRDIEAQVYNFENGIKSRVPFNPELVYEEKVSDNWYVVKFALPNVKAGSIIEYKYKHTSQSKFNLPDWAIQSSIPTHYTEYKLYINPFYTYTYLLQGATKFDIYTEEVSSGMPKSLAGAKYQETLLTWGMKEIPAFRDEGFITSREDYIMKLDFQLASWSDIYGIKVDVITTWPKLCNELINEPGFGKYINSASKYAKKLPELSLLNVLPEEERLEAMIKYVKNNYNWDGRNRYMASNSLKKFITEKSGSAAEINLFLCGLLQESGFEAYPVLISTRDHGKIKYDYPFAHYFNYVIVGVKMNGGYQFADATDTFYPNDLIPTNCINERGLVVYKASSEWAGIAPPTKSKISRSIIIDVPADADIDSLSVDYKMKSTKYDAVQFRKMYAGKYEKLEEYFEENRLKPLDSIQVENYMDLDEDFVISTKAQFVKETINNKIYITPFLNEAISENPFKQDSRTYPIDLVYQKTRVFYSEIHIPDGYTVESVPENMAMNGKLVQIDYKVVEAGESKLVVSGYYNFSSATYQADDYTNLKYYYNQIIKKFNEKLVLVKEE